MTELVKQQQTWLREIVDKAIERILGGEQVKTSISVAETVLDGFAIKSREDMEAAGDSARLIKRGLSALENDLKDAFRPLKEIERQARDSVRVAAGGKLDAALSRIDEQRRLWTREEDRRAREQQLADQKLATEAAAAAETAREAGGLADDEEAPSPAQIPVRLPERTVRGAVATTARVRKVKAVELVNATEAQDQWGVEVIALQSKVASDRYAEKITLGTLAMPPDGEAGVVVGGIRFVADLSFSDRGRGL